MAQILIIDDDQMICETLSLRVMNLGHTATTAHTLQTGLAKARSEPCDLVFLDVRLPDGNGLDQLPEFHATPAAPEIIIITGVGDPDGAELAVKGGAWDYIQKPFSRQQVTLQLNRALEFREKSRQKMPVLLERDQIIGNTPGLKTNLAQVTQAANADVNVLITGESGTGKELFARAIHHNSSRTGRPFVVVDCTTLPENLVESVLFGHKKGAFTGADSTEEGLIKQADGGTLFLDEVGELPLAIQKKFLRVLQEHRFRPVGSQHETASNFRLIAATHRDLELLVQTQQFRQDMFFRLRAFTIELAPLRERLADIRDLTVHHIARLCEHNGLAIKGVSPDCIEALEAYAWPGNVRELVATLERVITAEPEASVLYPQHLPASLRINVARKKAGPPPQPFVQARTAPGQNPLLSLKEVRQAAFAQIEQHYLEQLMQVTSGNIHEACRISGLGRARLYELCKKYRISVMGCIR